MVFGTITAVIAFIIFSTIIVYASLKYKGLPDCISQCYYAENIWFTIGMFSIAILTLISALELWDSIFAFLMSGCIAFVGAAPNYLDINEKKVHFTSACISAICSIIFSIVINPWALLCGLISLVSLIDKSRWLFWCELGCFLAVFLCLIF